MIVLALTAAALVAVMAVMMIRRPNEPLWRFAVLVTCWIPATAIAVEYAVSKEIAAALGYAGILVPFITCGVGFMIALFGARVLREQRKRSERDPMLAWATALAATPALLLIAEIVREIVMGSGARR